MCARMTDDSGRHESALSILTQYLVFSVLNRGLLHDEDLRQRLWCFQQLSLEERLTKAYFRRDQDGS